MSEKKITLIFGKRGSGKSYLAKKLCEKEHRLIVFDTIGEYTNGVIFTTEEREKFIEFWKHVYRGRFRIIYRPIEPYTEMLWMAELVYALGNVCFVVEEIDCYCSAYQVPEQLAHIIQRGRHRNISLIGITQRPYGIHRLLTSQAKEICIFNTNEPRDRDYLKGLLGQEIEKELDELKQFEFVKWEDGNEKLNRGLS